MHRSDVGMFAWAFKLPFIPFPSLLHHYAFRYQAWASHSLVRVFLFALNPTIMTLATLLFAVAPALLSVGAEAKSLRVFPRQNKTSSVVASTYFAGYHAERGFPVSSMPWEKYTDAKYAFA
jgi:hypothetical protein